MIWGGACCTGGGGGDDGASFRILTSDRTCLKRREASEHTLKYFTEAILKLPDDGLETGVHELSRVLLEEKIYRKIPVLLAQSRGRVHFF